jgi:1,4-dihydroxy-2-naphthoyl-CoA hydrolase
MRLIKIEEGYLEGSMPVDDRTKQPFGILHGGASVALAETLGSIGSNILAPEGHVAVGLEINANHVRSVGEGEVICKAQLVHRGKQTHVWDIRLYDEQGQMNCICRFTAAIRHGITRCTTYSTRPFRRVGPWWVIVYRVPMT